MPAPGEPDSSGATAKSPVLPNDGRRSPTASTSVVVGRLVLLAIAALALASAIILSRGRDRDRDRADQSAAERYVCPMHPEVVAHVPSDCPICGMALERASGLQAAAPSGAPSSGRVVETSRRVITQLVRGPAWVARDGSLTAVLHKDALIGLAPGEQAQFFPKTEPAAGHPVRLSSEPVTAWDGSTVQVRFQMEQARLAAPSTGWLQLAARPRELLIVPESAVLYSGEGAYVLAAAQGSSSFRRRSVEIGKILDSGHVADLAADHLGGIVVLSGLAEGERVVAGDTFFLDAQRRLQEAQGSAAEVIE